jgi:hypothetical protein
MICRAVNRTRSVFSIPEMLTPFTTARISSRNPVRNRNGSGEFVGDPRNQPRDQKLTGNHAPVQFIHHAIPSTVRLLTRASDDGARRDMEDAVGANNRINLETR